jgi:3-deoxy-D-manno-octulosonic-acid transferase
MWLLYDVLFTAALLAAAPWLLVRRGSHYLPTLSRRLGRHGEGTVPRGGLWIHAVSVGEVMVAATLARALPPDLPLVVTTVTPTGQERARVLFRDRAAVTFLPFDVGFAVTRFHARFAPRALVLVEGDYWPRLLRETRRRGLPVAVVNGRVGDRSFARMRRLRPFLELLFGPVGSFGVQSARDRDRLERLGVAPGRIAVTGNLKFEAPEPPPAPELAARIEVLAAGRRCLLAGSTMAGEEAAVVEAFAAAGGGEAALLIVAPRHPERFEEVARLLARHGLAVARRSRLEAAPQHPDALLLDSLGELAGLYPLTAAAFVGGTLVPTGGHNPIEPARVGVPTAVGPHMDNFRDMAELFDRHRAWQRVADGRGLGATWRRWLAAEGEARQVGERARALVNENRGALGRTLALLEPLLREVRAARRHQPPSRP